MALNLIALASIAGAIIVAFILIRRYLPRGAVAATGAENVCRRCGAPALSLTSFTCPGCGHDVREAGLGPRRGRTAVGVFWTVVVFTFAYVLVAMIAGNLLHNSLPTVYRVSRNTSLTVSSPEIRGIEMFLDAKGRDEDRLNGTLTGDLYGSAGVVTLEVEMPGRRWRLLDPTGKQLDAGEVLDGKVVYRWMELAGTAPGAATDSPVLHSDAAHIADAVGRLAGARIEMPPVPRTGRALSLSYSSSSGGGSSRMPDARWAPLMIIATTAAWLAGVYFILLSHRANAKHSTPASPIASAAEVTP
jgi:hypothetical protein